MQTAKRTWSRKHDILLYFSKSEDRIFNVEDVLEPYPEDYAARFKYQDEKGRYIIRGKGGPFAVGQGRLKPEDEAKHPQWTYRQYMKKGSLPKDWWVIQMLNANAPERLGYATQKPESLLDRIIRASSNEGDLVLDPFCGCGTTVAVAQRLNRRWVGIDITHLAVTLMKYRLENTFGEEIRSQYEVIGEPVSISGAMQLAKENPYQFQWWALGLLGARPVEEKKGADRGIDGRLYFHDEAKGGETKQIVFSVKSGHVTPYMMRDLRGVIEREGAEIGVLITMLDPTKDMRKEAAGAGFYESVTWQKRYPRIQILTIEDILRGKGVDCPPLRRTNVTFKKAPRAKKNDTNGTNDLFE